VSRTLIHVSVVNLRWPLFAAAASAARQVCWFFRLFVVVAGSAEV